MRATNDFLVLIFLLLNAVSWQIGFDQIPAKFLVWSLMLLCGAADSLLNNWDVQLEAFRLQTLFGES